MRLPPRTQTRSRETDGIGASARRGRLGLLRGEGACTQPLGHIALVPAPRAPDWRARGGPEANEEFYCGSPDDVLLQLFTWESSKTKWRLEDPRHWYEIVREKAGAIRRAGFTWGWLPPPCPATRPDGEGYEPTRLHCFDSSYGTEAELWAVIGALRGPDRRGTKALVDVVMNHRCGTTDWGDFSEPHYAGPGTHGPEEIAKANLNAVAPDDPWRRKHDPSLSESPIQGGYRDTYESTTAGRHLDHGNPYVREETKRWLKDYLLELGFSGFRYDMAAGFPAGYVGYYNDHAQPELSIGEYWREDAATLRDWVGETATHPDQPKSADQRRRCKSAAFDFALRARLWETFHRDDFTALRTAPGTPPGLLGLWPHAAVTFIENHDTEPVRGNGKEFPQDKILAGYAYLLTHPGKPMVFWSHFFNFGKDQSQQSFEAVISRMISIRKQNRVHSGSRCEIVAAGRALYAAIIDDRVAVKLGSSMDWRPGAGWTEHPVCWGKDFAIWMRTE